MTSQILRAFIAISLGPEVQRLIKEIQDELKKSDTPIAWVTPSNAHLTLKFLGPVSIDVLPSVTHAISLALTNFKSFAIDVGSIEAVPKGRHPRIIWLSIKSNADYVSEIVLNIEKHIKNLEFKAEARPFSAHITVGRMKSQRNIGNLTSALKNFQHKNPISYIVKDITLYQSQLTPSGPIYSIVEKFPLMDP